jgi:membrane protease subunit HflC
MEMVWDRFKYALIALAVGLIALFSFFFVVPETQQAVIVRGGEAIGTVNRFVPNEPFGQTGAGIWYRVPFLDQVQMVDRRVLDLDMDRQQVLSTDQLRLQVDAFARYRITDPLRMFITARTEDRVSDQLKPILGSALRNELGRRPFAALLSPERGQMMDNIQRALNRVASQYGAEIVDVRIKRADLPEGTPLESAYSGCRRRGSRKPARSVRRG